MQTKNAIGNLINRYRAVLKKCTLLNTFGTLAVAGMLLMGSAGIASAGNLTHTVTDANQNTTLEEIPTIGGVITGETFTLTAVDDPNKNEDLNLNVSKNGSPEFALAGNFIFAGEDANNDLILNVFSGQKMSVAGTTTITGKASRGQSILSIAKGGEFISTGAMAVNRYAELLVAGKLTVVALTTVKGIRGGHGILNIASGGEFISTGGTLISAFGEFNLGGTHTGIVNIENDGLLTGAGGTITGNLGVSQGTVIITNVGMETELTVSGTTMIEGTNAAEKGLFNIESGGNFKSEGLTTVGGFGILNLEGTLTGALTLNADTDEVDEAVLNADGGTITGDLTVTKGTVNAHDGSSVVKGTMTVAADSVVSGSSSILDVNTMTTTGLITFESNSTLNVIESKDPNDASKMIGGTLEITGGTFDITEGSSVNVDKELTLTAGVLTVTSSKISTGGTTLSGATGATFNLQGTHTGTVTLNGDAANKATLWNGASGGKISEETIGNGIIDGDLIVTKGTVNINKDADTDSKIVGLTVKGDMTLTQDSVLTLEADTFLTVTDDMSIAKAITVINESSLNVGGALSITADTTTVDIGGILKAGSTTISGTTGAVTTLELNGTHAGNLILNGTDISGAVLNTTTGAKVGGDLTLTKGTLTVAASKNLAVSGDMKIGIATDVSFILNKGSDLSVGGNLEFSEPFTPDESNVVVGKTLTLAGDYVLGTSTILQAASLAGKGDVIVNAGTLILSDKIGNYSDITIVAANDANVDGEVIFDASSTGTVSAGIVSFNDTMTKLEKGNFIVNRVNIADNKAVIEGAATADVSLTFRAVRDSYSLGVDTITVTNFGILNLGEAGAANIGSINDIDMAISLTGKDSVDDAELNLYADFTINSLSTKNTTIGGTTGILNVNTFDVNGETNVSGGTVFVEANGEIKLDTAGDILNIDGGTVDLTALKKALNGQAGFQGQININSGTLKLGGVQQIDLNFLGTAKDGNISINGGTLQANYIQFVKIGTDPATDAKITLDTATSTIEVNEFLALKGVTGNRADLEVTMGTLRVNGNGGGAVDAASITLNGAAAADAILILGETGGSIANVSDTAHINVTKGQVSVLGGKWTLVEDGTVNLEDTTSTLEIINGGSLTAGTVTLVGNTVKVNTGGSLTLDTLDLTTVASSTLEVDNGTIIISGSKAGDFKSVNATTANGSVTLANLSRFVITGEALLEVYDPNALAKVDAATVSKISSIDGTSTIEITGDRRYRLLDIGSIKDGIFATGSSGYIAVENLDFIPSDLLNGYVKSVKVNGSSVDITSQSGKTGIVTDSDGTASFDSFAANGIFIDTDGATPITTRGNVKLVGDTLVSYRGFSGKGNITVDASTGIKSDDGTVATAVNATLALVGAENGALNTVNLTTITGKTATLMVDGNYTIQSVVGSGGATGDDTKKIALFGGNLNIRELVDVNVNVAGGNLELGALTEVVVDATKHAANIQLETVTKSKLAFGGTDIKTNTSNAYGTNVVNVTIGEFYVLPDNSASIVTVGAGTMLAYGMNKETDTVVASNWIANSMESAELILGAGEGMIDAAFGVSSSLVLNVTGTNKMQTLNVGDITTATAGNAAFSEKSLFVVDATGVGFTETIPEDEDDTPAEPIITINTALTADTITAAAGAKLLITDVTLNPEGTIIKIAAGDLSGIATGAWGKGEDETTDKSLFFESAFLAGIAEFTATGATVTVEQVLAKDALDDGALLDNSLAALIDAAEGKVTKFIKDASLSKYGSANIIEGGAKLGTVAGILPSLNSVSNSSLSNVQSRNSITAMLMASNKLNYEGDSENLVAASSGTTFITRGGETNRVTGFGFWAMPMYQTASVTDLESGNFKYGNDTNFFGVSAGADYTFGTGNNSAIRVGATFNTGNGTTDSTGDFAETNNDFSYIGYGAYATVHVDNVSVTLDFSTTATSNDIIQNTLGSSLSATPDADLTSFGVRAEYYVPVYILDVMPYAGLRWNSSTVDGYTSTYKHDAAFITKSQTSSIVEFPVGLSMRTAFKIGNRTFIEPKLDLGVKFATGDLNSIQEVQFPGIAGSASMESVAVDALTFQGGLGLTLSAGDAMRFDVEYKLDISSNVTNHGAFGTFRYNF